MLRALYSEIVLEKLVLENLCKVISYIRDYEDDFVQRVTHNMLSEQTERITQAKRQL